MRDALLLTMMNPPADGDAEFNAWADTEHVPERKGIPGIRTGLRFRNQAPSPRYMALYDLEDVAVLRGPSYIAIAGDNLSPWSKRVLAGATARWRFEGTRIDTGPQATWTGARGNLGCLLLVLWRGLAAPCDATVGSALDAAVAGKPGILQWRAFGGQRDGRHDYVGVVESARPFDADCTDPARYSTPSLRSECAYLFNPI